FEVDATSTAPITATLCRTDPATGLCVAAAAARFDLNLGPGDTATVAVFVSSTASIPFDPAAHRLDVRVRSWVQGGEFSPFHCPFPSRSYAERGATSVAVRTP